MPVDTTDLLETERLALLAAVDRVAQADRDRRPAPGQWSVAEILEHLARVEQAVTALIATRGREPLPPAVEPPARGASERVAGLRVRERRIDAPGALRPSGAVSADEAVAALAASRRALLDAARAADPAALEHRTYYHAVLGRLTLRDWLAFIAHHEARHAAQIDEVAAALRQERPADPAGADAPVDDADHAADGGPVEHLHERLAVGPQGDVDGKAAGPSRPTRRRSRL